MKLWTTIELEYLPKTLKKGIRVSGDDELMFWDDITVGAENALSFEGELAFIEADIPDDQIEAYFAPCPELVEQRAMSLQSQIAYSRQQGEETSEMEEDLETIFNMETAKDSFDYFGYACLTETLPPTMLKLLDLNQTLEALESGDADAVAHAIETAEATPFKALGAAFWVWLVMLIEQIFGPGQGAPVGSEEAQEKVEEEEAEQLERMRRVAVTRPRRKKKAKKRS